MLNITRQISNFNFYNGNNIKYIVVHYVGACSTAKNNADYFGGGNRDASAHYFVDDNSIYQVVEDFNGAWSVGNTRTEVNNRNSLNIEMCCDPSVQVTQKTEENTLELVKYLMSKYNISVENVRTHYEVSGCTKICPNWSDNNWARWNAFKANLSDSKSCECNNTNTPQTETIIKEYSEVAKFYPSTTIYFRNKPYVGSDNPVQGTYNVGESVNYDYVVITNKYVWISWISSSAGVRRYMPVRDRATQELWGRIE